MGGHAAFIWPSYAVVFAVLIVLLVVSIRGLRNAEADLAALEGGADENHLNKADSAEAGQGGAKT